MNNPKATSDMPAIDKLVSAPLMTRVLVIGAGPVGLTLAMDLATRGIEVTVVETRSAGEPPSVKCNHVSARSMEIFRRLGLAQRAARHRIAGRLSERLRLSHHGDRHRAVAHPDSLPARPLHRERAARTPIGRRRSRRTGSTRSTWSRCCSRMLPPSPGFTILNRTAFEDFSEDARRRRCDRRATSTAMTTSHIRLPTSSSAATARVRWCARRSAPLCRARRSSSACSRPISTRPLCSPDGRSRPG